MENKNGKMTLDKLAGMVARGFEKTATKEEMNVRFDKVEIRLGSVEERLDRVEFKLGKVASSLGLEALVPLRSLKAASGTVCQ